MINIITDWMFIHGYLTMGICGIGAFLCLVIGFVEAAQDEIEELVRFKEEKNDRIH